MALAGAIAVLIAIFQQSEAVALLWVLFAALVLVAIILFTWPWLKTGRWRVPWPPRWRRKTPLSLAPSVRELETPWDSSPHQLLQAHFTSPHFAVIAVTNDLDRDVTVVPQVYVDGEEVAGTGAWAEEPGDTFAPATVAGMHFNVGAKRLLVLAVAFTETNYSAVWYPVRSRDDTAFCHDVTRVVARNLRLGSSPEIRVRFRAEGIDQAVSLDLGFSADGGPMLRRPVAPPRSKSGS